MGLGADQHDQAVYGPASQAACFTYKQRFLDSNPMYAIMPAAEYRPVRIIAPPPKPFPLARAPSRRARPRPTSDDNHDQSVMPRETKIAHLR